MGHRNQNNAQANKTLRTRCSSCAADIPTDVSTDPTDRQTWALVGRQGGAASIFPVCAKCYGQGWRPPGYEGA
ncbi:MAG TPA: hypothetical protein VEC57_20110 [Candidatus Limnocylindrales bacterium]|nr:hypothetical protein [Candidatus Limnocylindrales bacterium]